MKKYFLLFSVFACYWGVLSAEDTASANTVYKLHLGKASCAVDLGDGSERGEYVNQDYILQRLGRPHRAIGLMYCYYPLDKGWPNRASKVFKSSNNKSAWGYPYDDYFPYQGGIGGNTKGEPFKSMRDIRKHGQDVNITLTIDCAVTDEHLKKIAQDLRPFGRINLRINHEATGRWFAFNKRYSYQQVADFFAHCCKIIKKEAPNIKILLCINGIHKLEEKKMMYEKEFTEAIRTADIWSIDKYIALHWGWPNDIAEPDISNHKLTKVNDVHTLNKRTFERFIKLNNGKKKTLVLSEINADGDVTGQINQAGIIKAFYDKIKDGTYNFYSAVTMYQFRDRGRLGLEQEDPNNPNVGIEQPLLKVYRKIIHDPFFSPSMKRDSKVAFPVKMRWGGAEDSDGIAIPIKFQANPVFCEVSFDEPLNLMIEINGKWFYKAPTTKTVDLMPAFWEKPLSGEKELTLHIFAPPATGENNPEQGDGWDINYYSKMTKAPSFRIRYKPTKSYDEF